MPRPRKWRRVCALPKVGRFGPLDACGSGEPVRMTVDEYEAVRLIDLDGLTQEECSARMNVARTTVQGIYDEARRKIAYALVNGRALHIEGGDYRLCDGEGVPCCPRGCKKRRCAPACGPGGDSK